MIKLLHSLFFESSKFSCRYFQSLILLRDLNHIHAVAVVLLSHHSNGEPHKRRLKMFRKLALALVAVASLSAAPAFAFGGGPDQARTSLRYRNRGLCP